MRPTDKSARKKRREREIKQRKHGRSAMQMARNHLYLATDALNDNDYKTAEASARKALRVAPGFKVPHYLLADACRAQGDYESALESLLAIVGFDSESPSIWFFTLDCYWRLGRYAEALAYGARHVRWQKGRRFGAVKRDIQALLRTCRERGELLEKTTPSSPLPHREETPKPGKSAVELPSEENIRPDVGREHPVKIPDLTPTVSFEHDPNILQQIEANHWESWNAYEIRLLAENVSLYAGFDSLLCLEHLRDVDHYWFQVETVKKVLRHFRGRVILADEVGLGKTVEAGMALSEYILRGLVRKVLVLTPPSLISQWREELAHKFSLDFVTTEDPFYSDNPDDFWRRHDRIIASINVAKSKRNFDFVSEIEYDLVIVDEAHHLRNRNTVNWNLVNAIKKKFIFLLTATPVQNNLVELYNLITLLRPGTLKTLEQFRRDFTQRGEPRSLKNRERLRELLREVMVRNTRSLADVKLPRRYASTLLIEPSPEERDLYEGVTALVRDCYGQNRGLDRLTLAHLQREAGSSPFALRRTLSGLIERKGLDNLLIRDLETLRDKAERLSQTKKAGRLLEMIRSKQEKIIVFTQYTETLKYLSAVLQQAAIPFGLFHGGLTASEKDDEIRRFRDDVYLLLSTESGGEGRNLQFCCTMVNYDLPWNPMRIEQRIGRLHRIGQQHEVFIFNLCGKDTVEDHLLRILGQKINMFELVIGELDMILGHWSEEREFPDIVMDIWARSDAHEVAQKFDRLGEELLQAKTNYLKSKELDQQLFAEEFEV